MLARTREVTRAWDRVKEELGERSIMGVFPLSPSGVVWGRQSGCDLPRILRKAYGFTVKMPDFVFMGSIVDRMVEEQLRANLSGTEPGDIEQIGYEHFFENKASYDEVGDGFADEAVGVGLAAVEHFRDVVPSSVQRPMPLYIGAGSAEIPADSPSENPDWVWGFSDWTTLGPGSASSVHDLKCRARTVKYVSKDSLQLFTYASSIYQSGEDVRQVHVEQINKKSKQLVTASSDFTAADYERTIQIYREARDQYLALERGERDLLIPYRGAGKCSNWSCHYYDGCPLGGNSKRAREAMMEV